MNGYDTSPWESFFVAEAGVAAVLAGLVFVAVSINLSRILEFPALPGRALEALLLFLSVLVAATLGLVPGQPRNLYGAELLALGVVWLLLLLVIQVRSARHAGQHRRWVFTRAVTTLLGTAPIAIAGASLCAGTGGGLYWLAAGVLLSFAGGLVDSWVLLVEIQR